MRKIAVSAGVILLLLLAMLLAGQWLQRSLAAAGLEQLDWQQIRWSEGALRAEELSGTYRLDEGQLGFRAQQVIVRPVWRSGPRIENIDINGLQLTWQPVADAPLAEPEQSFELPALADFRGLLAWLPDQIEVRSMQLQLPCAGDFCRLQGGLQLTTQQQPLDLSARLGLINEGQTLSGWLKIQERPGSYLVQAGAYIPQPLPLTGFGQLSGDLRLDLQNRGEQWLLREGQLQALLAKPELAAFDSLPAKLRPDTVRLEITPQPISLADWQENIALAAKLQLTGALSGEVTASLELSATPEWHAQLSKGHAKLALSQWHEADLQADKLAFESFFDGQLDGRQLQLQLPDKTSMRVNSLLLPDLELRLSDLHAELTGAQLKVPFGDADSMQLIAPVKLTLGRVEQPLLKPQSWDLQGTLIQAANGLKLDSRLEAHSGLAADIQFSLPAEGPWQADVTLQEMFLRAANPLLGSFVDWPALLNFSTGRLTGHIKAQGDAGLDQVTGEFSLTGGDGIYDRSSFTGLSLPVRVALRDGQLTLATDALALSTLDPGMPLGPLAAAGEYRASLQALDAGVLNIKSAQLGVLGGRVQLEPAALDLHQSRQTFTAIVQGVELTRLFEVYPAEGLSGQGTLDGRFPVSLMDGKLIVEAGQLQARQPGGTLRYRDQRLQDLAVNNPNMRQLASALEDFHYRVLASDVSYDEHGTLILGLRLEGSNPNFQDGRMVNLNIRLEEDIPALLTSLQLSGQVSDIIKERVQQHYLHQSKP